MSTEPITQRGRMQRVIDDLSSLITLHGGMLASEQHAPQRHADESDEYMKEHADWVRELRAIRERVENLMTGVVSDDPDPARQVVVAARTLLREWRRQVQAADTDIEPSVNLAKAIDTYDAR